MSSLSTLVLKSPTNIFIWYLGSLSNVIITLQFLIEAAFHIISSILCWGMNIQNNNMISWSEFLATNPEFDSRRYKIFCIAVDLEQGPLSLMRINEELL
jgi:hypothetical protein